LYIIADTFGAELFEKVLPENYDFEILETILFIEIELSDPTNGDFTGTPERGINLALFYNDKNDPVIMIGKRTYREHPQWSYLMERERVAFCNKNKITADRLLKAIKKVI